AEQEWRDGGSQIVTGSDRGGGTRSLQRVPLASSPPASGGGGTCPCCSRTSRWRRSVADRHGDAGGRGSPPVGGRVRACVIRIGTHSRLAAGRGSQAARVDAGDEVHRCGL